MRPIGRKALQFLTRKCNGAIFLLVVFASPFDISLTPSTSLSQVWDHIAKRVKWADTGVEMKVGGGRFSHHEREKLTVGVVGNMCQGILRPSAPFYQTMQQPSIDSAVPKAA